MTKVCTKCGTEYPLTAEYFYVQRCKPDGFQCWCKVCTKENDHIRRQKTRERRYTVSKEWKKNNPEKMRAIVKRGYQKNREKYLASNRAWAKRNPEKRKAINQRWLERTPHEKMQEHWRLFRERHPDRIQYQNARMRSVRKGLVSTLTADEWKVTLDYFNNECAYCGSTLAIHKDHVVPCVKGGGFTKENIIPACPDCNNRKKARDMTEWYSAQPFFSQTKLYDIQRFIEGTE